MFECPNCGGNVKFDIASQQLDCEYCHTKLDPYHYESKTRDAEEQPDFENFEVTIFTCPQCGGEILSTDNAAAGFCSFCGASTVLYSRISNERRPNYLIPFQKTKEDCKVAYSQLMKKAIFAPKELKDSSNIDSFRGIYMPYWAFYITQKGPFRLNGKKSHRRGDYIITDHFSLEGDLNAYYKGLSYDASSSFADNISEALAPYDVKGMKAFTPAFFSGFYADTADVSSDLYRPEAEHIAFEETFGTIKKNPAFSSYTIDPSKQGGLAPDLLHTQTSAVDQSMFPVWFMSYRNGDRVAYATVNGQTGKVVMDLPVDIRKFLLGSLVLALPLFILLNLFFTVIPSTLLTIIALITLTSVIISTVEIKKIAKQESDGNDLGLLSKTDPQKAEEKSRRFQRIKAATIKKKSSESIASQIIIIVVMLGVLLPFGSIFFALTASLITGGLIWIAILIGTVVCACMGFARLKEVPGRKGGLGLTAALAGIGISAIVTLLHPASDLFYYGAAILSLAAVFLTLKEGMDQYNILSTRRLPQFDKEGGDNRA